MVKGPNIEKFTATLDVKRARRWVYGYRSKDKKLARRRARRGKKRWRFTARDVA